VKIVDANLNYRTKIWVFLMRLGAVSGCHQLHDRSFFFGNYQFPVCARCTGLFIGYITGIIFSSFIIKFELIKIFICTFLSVSALGVDGVLQLKKIIVSNNRRRLITGLLCGFFLMGFVVKVIYEITGNSAIHNAL
jgi:uncharacterized membrane protein